MSLNRNYVIASGVVAFISWALLTDWIPALRFLPHAFLLGASVALLAGLLIIITTARPIRTQAWARQPNYGPRAPAFTNALRWEEEKAGLKGREEYRRPAVFPEVLKFSKAVDGLLDLVLRDFVTSWYGKISARPLFQHEVDRAIRAVLLSIISRLTDEDLVELATTRMLPIVTNHLKDFYDAERLVRGKNLTNNVTESDELSAAIAGKYKNGKLHPVASLALADTVSSTQAHLRRLMQKILPKVLPANMKSSAAVMTLIREIVACAVLSPIINMLTEPDTWNQMIVSIGGTALRDRKTVRKVRAALDEHAPSATIRHARSGSGGGGGGANMFPRLRPYDSERQFERFIRAIRQVGTLTDARRFRSEIVTQLRRDAQVEGQDAAYLRRLDTGKRLLEQRITDLTSTMNAAAKPRASGLPVAIAAPLDSDSVERKRKASLREVIYDAAGLSYFMEFMDRQRAMRQVQFYLVVDGFRSPLEGDADEPPASTINDPDRMDIGQMYEGYLSKPEIRAPDATMQVVRNYLKAGNRASLEQYIAARRGVLQLQTQTYNTMKEEYYEAFKRSDLYYKWLAVDDSPALALKAKQVGQHTPAISEDTTRSSGHSTQMPPPAPRRPQLAALQKGADLRRAALSSTDLKSASSAAKDLFSDAPRRSLDELAARPALFDDDIEDERMTQSAASLKSYDSDGERAHLQQLQAAQEQAKVVDAMQLALDDIVGDEHREPLFDDVTSPAVSRKPALFDEQPERARTSEDMFRPPLPTRTPSGIGKPNIASLGLVGPAPSSKGVPVDDLFSEDTSKFVEDEKYDQHELARDDDDGVQEAAPGDLGLTEAIDVLNADIERLHAQKSVLDSLTAKAELTNNTAELRILRKSEQSLQREIKRKEMQKQQYVVQESDNSLYGKAAVRITSVMVGKEEDGHEFALYVIEVRRQAGDNMPAATWAVTRRYSQFHELHKRLKARFPAVKDLDFPRRQALFTLQKDFVQKRRIVLERYLRALLLVPAICRSRELRAFLSQSAIASHGSGANLDTDANKDFVTRIYNSVSDGMEEFLGNIPVLDQLSVAGQNLISAATAQISGASPVDSLDPGVQDPSTAAEAEAELNAYETKETAANEPFVKPICDLFLEIFELSKGNSWLRGRTAVVVLHQLLGGTIERKVRETMGKSLEDDSLARTVESLQAAMWPAGKMRPSSVPRTVAEKVRARKEAGLLLEALLPDLAGSVVGKANAQAAGRKIVAILNSGRLK